MFVALAVIVVVLVGVSIVGLRNPLWFRTLARQRDPVKTGTLRGYAREASADGLTSITFSVSPFYMGPSSLDDVVSDYSTVVAQLLRQEVTYNETEDDITTWYKFRISETLSKKPFIPCTGCTGSEVQPANLLPLRPGEILVPLMGGATMIENVIVVRKLESFPGFVDGKTYLLFLNIDTTSSMGSLDFGPRGALLVSADNILMPVMPSEDLMIVDMASQYGSSLNQLREALKPSSMTPKL
jgi:hypothetical protein